MTLFSLTPTFTQGLVLGQLSILLLLAFILRYLFFDAHPLSTDDDRSDADVDTDTHSGAGTEDLKDRPLPIPIRPLQSTKDSFTEDFQFDVARQESLEWFNLLLDGVCPAHSL